MSTAKINIRFAQLARSGEIIFHIGDLANLWQIQDQNTLHTTLKRYTQKGLLFRIYRGFYSLKPIDKLDPYLLGIKAMHKFAYISTQTVLESIGIIAQKINYITLVSSSSKRFSIGDNNYYCRQLADKFLFNSNGIIQKNGLKIATKERAIADLLYFNPRAHFDAKIKWVDIKRIQKRIGYPLTPNRYI